MASDVITSLRAAANKALSRKFVVHGDGSYSEQVTHKRANVKCAHLDMSTATTTDIVAAVTGKKIRVLEYTIFHNDTTATNVNFATGASTTRVTGSPIYKFAAAAGQIVVRRCPDGGHLFESASNGDAIRVTNSGASDITVALVYQEV